MKVKHVFQALSDCNPEDEIIIDWWEKDTAQEWFEKDEGEIITDEIWFDVVKAFEDRDYSEFNDELINYIAEKLRENK